LALPRDSECLGISTFFRGIMETVPRLFHGIFRNEIPFLSLLTSFTSTNCVELDEHSHGLYKLARCTAITIILTAFTSTCTYKTKQNFVNFFPAIKFFALLCVHFLFYCDLDDNFGFRFGLAKSSRSGSGSMNKFNSGSSL
jgi:hypothetical protein